MTRDFRLAVRRLTGRPGRTLLMVGIIAIGIGSATAVFSVVDQTILRPPPFAYADRLVGVLHKQGPNGGGGNNLSPEKIAGWQEQRALFERFEAYAPLQMDVAGDGPPERTFGLNITLGLFPMLGVAPRAGRGFVEGDGRPGAPPVAIISDSLRRRRFGARADALGRTIALNDREYTIVGIMPRRFHLQGDAGALASSEEAFWLPVDIHARLGDATLRGFYGVGRLAPGVRMADAQRTADRIAGELQRISPLSQTWYLRVEQKGIASVDATTRMAMYVLLGAVLLVVLITCANVAALLLADAPQRQREAAISCALGASRARLVRTLLAETLLLAAAGGTVGLLFARWALQAIMTAAPTHLVYSLTTTIEIDARVIGAACLLTAATAVLFGVFPAIRASAPALESMLRSSGGRVTRSRMPSALVALEVAFSVVLLAGAVLMMRTLVNLESIRPGFDPNGLVAVHVDLPSDRYPSTTARIAFFATLFERLARVPGVSALAAAQGVPPTQGGFSWGELQGEGGVRSSAEATVPWNTVTPGYFAALRMPIVAGRVFGAREDPEAVIISTGLADRVWPAGGAIGRRFRIGDSGPWHTVVGIAANVESRIGADTRTSLQLYFPWVARAAGAAAAPTPRRRTYDYRVLIVRAEHPERVTDEIEKAVWSIDGRQPLGKIELVSDIYAEAFGRQRFVLLLMGSFSLIALALTAAGIFGLLSQLVSQRTREIGIRIALGARPAQVLHLIVSRGLIWAAIGCALGMVAALWLVPVLRSLLFGVTPTDPLSFAAVVTLLLSVALAACWLPARAAARVDPAVALRSE